MNGVIETRGLGKDYRRKHALRDCTLCIPSGRVVGLVGPNGAGKTTLLHLAVGLIAPTSGTITVLGRPPASNTGQLGRVGFVAQDAPAYARLSVQIVWATEIRQHLMTPAHTIVALSGADLGSLGADGSNILVTPPAGATAPGDWLLSTQTVDPAGHLVGDARVPACLTSNVQACQSALARLHLRDVITYQPASRFWAFQWYETGIFLALASALAVFCVWRLSRRGATT